MVDNRGPSLSYNHGYIDRTSNRFHSPLPLVISLILLGLDDTVTKPRSTHKVPQCLTFVSKDLSEIPQTHQQKDLSTNLGHSEDPVVDQEDLEPCSEKLREIRRQTMSRSPTLFSHGK